MQTEIAAATDKYRQAVDKLRRKSPELAEAFPLEVAGPLSQNLAESVRESDSENKMPPGLTGEREGSPEKISGRASRTASGKAGAEKPHRKTHGIFEKVPGSEIYWIRYHDAHGRLRREKAGTRGMAIKLYQKRKTEALQGKKLPETIRRKAVLFRDLAEDAVLYAQEHHRTNSKRDYRADLLIELFGARAADSITPQEIDRQLSKIAREREWAPASYNRFKAFISLAYRLGIENDRVTVNPARLVRRRREDNGRIRWLSADEETKLRAVILSNYPHELPAFDLALHTGMRRSEQYGLTWDCVDFVQRQITIPRSKHGGIRYLPLDNTALDALLTLRKRSDGKGAVMVLAESGHGYSAGHALQTPKEWFMAAIARAGIADFTWHCLRHTFASRLVMAGVDLRKVQELMGHKTIAMTCRYAHLAPQHLQDAVNKLDGWGQDSKPKNKTATDTKTDTGAFAPPQTAKVASSEALLQ